jgi:hypothetical protein
LGSFYIKRMIQQSLLFVSTVLNQALKLTFDVKETLVIINNVIQSDGTVPAINKNKIVLSLINIEKETAKPFYNRNQQLSNGNYADVNPSERFNLDLLITSNFEDYAETLKYLTAVIAFFQSHVSITANSNSNIPLGISKLEFDIEKISFFQMHQLWSAMGAKYRPSVIYKMRLITIEGDYLKGISKFVSATSNTIEA